MPLFEKAGVMRLTRYGRLFLQSAIESLQSWTKVPRCRNWAPAGIAGAAGHPGKLAAQTVPELMHGFLAQPGQEGVRFELHTESGFSRDLLQAVAEERLDMAFVSHPGDPTVFECLPFKRSPFVVVVPPGHPLAEKESVTLTETLPYPYVYFSKRGGLRPAVDAMFRAIGAQPEIAYETEEDTVVAGMAAAGFGIAIVPDHPVLRCLDLKILPITAPDSGRTAYLCRKRSAQLPEAASCFYQYCAETLPEKNC